MNTRSVRVLGSLFVAVLVGLLTVPEARAGGKHGGHSGGGAKHPPRMSTAHRANKAPSYKAPKMSRAKSPARANANAARSNNVATRGNAAQGHVGTGQSRNRSVSGATTAANFSPNTYQYGYGGHSRRYQAYGYGRGYRNRYSAGRSGYGRSQGNVRSIVARLRSVHRSLARLDHDYRGHRVRAMHHLSMAIRQLSHRSMISGVNGLNMNRNGNAGVNARRVQHLSQAQADTRMSQALRTTQGIAMQMSHQGANTTGHHRARGHLQRAMHEMNTALTAR